MPNKGKRKRSVGGANPAPAATNGGHARVAGGHNPAPNAPGDVVHRRPKARTAKYTRKGPRQNKAGGAPR